MLRAAVCLFFAELLFGLTLCDDLGYICSFMYKMEREKIVCTYVCSRVT